MARYRDEKIPGMESDWDEKIPGMGIYFDKKYQEWEVIGIRKSQKLEDGKILV